MLASALFLGVAAGWLSGGRLARLGRLRIRWWPLLAIAIALRLAAPIGPELAPFVYITAFAAIVAVALANLPLPGMPLIAAGAAMNLVVVSANGGMPVDPIAVSAAGIAMPSDRLHLALDAQTRFALLADVIPLGVFRSVYSVGDVVLAAGAFWLPLTWMRRS